MTAPHIAYEAVTFFAIDVGHNQTEARVKFFDRTPHVSRFGKQLFELFLNADVLNRQQLGVAYPEVAELFRRWTVLGPNAVFDWLKENPMPAEWKRAAG